MPGRLWVIFLVCFMLLAERGYAQSCQLPAEFQIISRHLSPLANEEDLTSSQRARLAESLEDVRDGKIARELEESGLGALTLMMQGFMKEARKLADGEDGVKTWLLRDLMHTMEQDSLAICLDLQGTSYMEDQQEREGGYSQRDPNGSSTWSEGGLDPSEGEVLSLWQLLLGLIFVVATLLAFDRYIRRNDEE